MQVRSELSPSCGLFKVALGLGCGAPPLQVHAQTCGFRAMVGVGLRPSGGGGGGLSPSAILPLRRD